MAAYNDITGDPLRSKAATENYRNNFDAIFGKKDKAKPEVTETTDEKEVAKD